MKAHADEFTWKHALKRAGELERRLAVLIKAYDLPPGGPLAMAMMHFAARIHLCVPDDRGPTGREAFLRMAAAVFDVAAIARAQDPDPLTFEVVGSICFTCHERDGQHQPNCPDR